jgi:pyridoxine 4-dehydrogenase
MSIALPWLLQRPPNILLIPGTSSAVHLRENVVDAGLSLPGEDLAELDKIGRYLALSFHAGRALCGVPE